MLPCKNCGAEPAISLTHGYGNACYQRWRKAGKPPEGPPEPTQPPPSPEHRAAINAVLRAARDERVALFRRLDRDRTLTDEQIGEAMGLTARTVNRYRAADIAAGLTTKKSSDSWRPGRRSRKVTP